MNKVDLVRSAVERVELSRKDAVALVDGVFEDIQAACIAGDAVKIPGFGQFKVRDRAARKALKEAVMSKRGRAGAARKKAGPKAAARKAPTAARKSSSRKKR
jgi:nucleoid DNA-binding protein